MYSKDKLQKILDTLIEGTKSGYIKWTLKNSMFNSDTQHNMEYKSDDGLTSFSMNVTLSDNLLSLSKSGKTLRINNEDLVDNAIMISDYDLKDTRVLCELIYQKFVKPKVIKNLPKSGVIDNILNNINKQHIRQEKIDDILDDSDIEAIENEAKRLVEKRIKEAKEGKKPTEDESYKDKMSKESEPKRKKFLGLF